MADTPLNKPARWPYGPVTLAELCAGLVWPMLLRVPGVALQPPKLAVAFLLVAGLLGVGGVFDMLVEWAGGTPLAMPLLWACGEGLSASARLLLDARLGSAIRAAYDATFGGVVEAVRNRPVAATAFIGLALPLWSIAGGAICRMAAVDLALNLNMTAAESIRFAAARWKGHLFVHLIPLLAIGAIALALAMGGWLLLSLPGVALIGAVLFGVAMLGGLAVAVLVGGLVAGSPLLPAAMSVEGTDAGDAVQRVYAYLLGRTGRAVLYTGIGLLQAAAVLLLAHWLVHIADWLASSLAGAWLEPSRADRLFGPANAGPAGAARSIIELWRGAGGILLGAVGISLWFSNGSALYLLLRRVNDEQDVREIWMPGLIPGGRVSDGHPDAA